jgi:hypothetical protein
MLVTPVYGADVYLDADIGDIIPLQGTSYIGNSVYLFLTGPGLPANGVTLTDTTQRADQGHFTIVNLDSNQKWSLKWNTKRIKPNITLWTTYTVYVSSQPVDFSHLGGTDTYKTIDVYFSDPGNSEISFSTGTSYTLNPEEHSSTAYPTVIIPSPTPIPTNAIPDTTIPTIPATTTTPVKKTPASPVIVILAVLGCVFITARCQQNRH